MYIHGVPPGLRQHVPNRLGYKYSLANTIPSMIGSDCLRDHINKQESTLSQ